MVHTFFIKKPPTAQDSNNAATGRWLDPKLEVATAWASSQITSGINAAKQVYGRFDDFKILQGLPLPFPLWWGFDGFRKLVHRGEKPQAAIATGASQQVRETPRRSVAIIGGGASGLLLGAQLAIQARQKQIPIDVILFEEAAKLGGKAYSTEDDDHLLNVRAIGMSAFPDQPDHFFQWAKARDHGVTQDTFMPRKLYGEYLREILQQSVAGNSFVHFRHIQKRVVGLQKIWEGQQSIQTASGETYSADDTVLALGNFDSPDPLPQDKAPKDFFTDSPQYISDPYAGDRAYLKGQGDVFILGTGLTMVDAVISLHRENPTRQIIALSRNGDLPRAHNLNVSPLPAEAAKKFQQSALEAAQQGDGAVEKIEALIREQIKKMPKPAEDWRSVIDALRPITIQVWQTLSANEKFLFLEKHVTQWNNHRHRIPPKSAELIQKMIREEKLQIVGGELDRIEKAGGDLAIRWKSGSVSKTTTARYFINCTGPESDYTRLAQNKRYPLVTSLFNQRLVQADNFGTDQKPIRLGLLADSQNRLIDASGKTQPHLWGVGPTTKGTKFEITAIPDIRGEVEQVARQILASVAATQSRSIPLIQPAYLTSDFINGSFQ